LGGIVGGDFNGDGTGDVISSAPQDSQIVTGNGAAFLFLSSGTFGASVNIVDKKINPNFSKELNYKFERAKVVGDVNGDGYDDVLTYLDSQGKTSLVLFYGSIAGVSLQNFKKDEASNLIDIVESATLFYEHTFSQSSEAKKYLESRGVSNEMIQKFRIGFAPNDWRQLYGKLNKAGYSDEEIVTSGLCIKHERGLYDRFRNRVMFPIMNASGKVVAFSGRIMPTAPVENSATPGTVGNQPGHEPAKYVNSPEYTQF
jgi:DNA primase